jgi:predicted RNA-binding protein with PIN domain
VEGVWGNREVPPASARDPPPATVSGVPDPTLYLFDGWNLLHAGNFSDSRELRDTLASFVAMQGARGVLVFDGAGQDEQRGPLEVRYATNADALLERLAAEHRGRERVCLVSSDSAVRGTAGQEVTKRSSRTFLADRLDAETQERLERLRRGQG